MTTSQHTYSFRTRFLPLLVMVGWLLTGSCLFAFFALRTGTVPPPEKQLGFWSPWLLLSAIAIVFQIDYLRRFRPIEVADEGLWFGSKASTRSQLVRWDEIKGVEPFPLPEHPRYGREKGGIRILSQGKPLPVYARIGGYRQFLAALKGHLSGRGISVPESS